MSKQLEPDDLPSSLYVPESSLSSLSPARIRRALRHVFNSKGNIVGDLSSSLPATKSRLKPSLSEKDLLSAINGKGRPNDDIGTHIASTLVIDDRKTERSVSLSPKICRNRKSSAPDVSFAHIIRIIATDDDHCNYKSLMVGNLVLKNTALLHLFLCTFPIFSNHGHVINQGGKFKRKVVPRS